MIKNLTLRELIIERIFFAFAADDLEDMFGISGDEVEQLSDLDLLELYEETIFSQSNDGCDEI